MAEAIGTQLRLPSDPADFVPLFANAARATATAALPPPNPLVVQPPTPWVRPTCPYPGIRPFTEADRARFFGRADEMRSLRTKLAARRLVFVIGASGCGKSSLVQAGLIPGLRNSAQFATRTWDIRPIRPGPRPLDELAQVVGTAPGELDAAREHGAAGQTATQLLLIVDPFEELFTLAADTATAFYRSLTQMAKQPWCYVVIVVRADFYPELMAPPFWPDVQAGRIEIGTLGKAQLRAMIEGPARTVGVTIDPALVERLIADAADEPGVLPLLQETLVHLWDELDGPVLAVSAYDALAHDSQSPLFRTLSDRASSALAMLSSAEQAIAWRAFLRLIQFGEGRANTRRQQFLADLRSVGDDPTAFDQVIKHLVDHRLLTVGNQSSGAAVADVAHEALLTRWPALIEFYDRHKSAEQIRRRYDALALEWAARRSQSVDAGLLGAGELGEIERWLSSDAARAVGYSQALIDLTEQSRQAIAHTQRQLSQAARQLSSLRRILIALTGSLALVALVALGQMAYYELMRRAATRDAQMIGFSAGAAPISFRTGPDSLRAVPAFYLDKYETPNAYYRVCVDSGACTLPIYEEGQARLRNAQFDQRPVVGISALQAQAYCRWRGARLPSPAEWERALHGADGRRESLADPHAYGPIQMQFDSYAPTDTIDVTALPPNATPADAGAALHLLGNVEEIVEENGPSRAPQFFAAGGSYENSVYEDFSQPIPIDREYGQSVLGFRCAAD